LSSYLYGSYLSRSGSIMQSFTIGKPSEVISDLLYTQEDTYWEANTCDGKDQEFNLIRLLTNEYMELPNISVQDHQYEYEVITVSPHELLHTLEDFQLACHGLTRRQRTAEQLSSLLKRFNHHLHL